METMKRKQLETVLFSTIGVVVMFFILVGANIILGLFKVRVDLTAEKSHTLSAGTKAILAKLDTPVKIRLYCTQSEAEMPLPMKNYARRVEDILQEIRTASHGRVEIEKLDPQPDTQAEESASLDGVEGQSMNLTDRFYLGLAVSCLDLKESIPFLSPNRERLLEYDISRAISRVIKPEKSVVGVMSALPVFGMPMNPMMMQMGQQGREPWAFISELRRDFTVKEVGMDTDKIDDQIKVLIVLYPKGISDKSQFAIDQFVLRGGKLVAFLDPLSIADNRNAGMNPLQRASSSGATMDKLLKNWGVEMDVNKVVADMNYMIQIGRGGREETAPAVMLLTQKGINADDIVTGQIDSALVPYSGVFTGTPASGLTQTVLLKTSERSQLIEKMMAEMGGESVVKSFNSSGKEYPLAIRLSGKFKTAFPDGKPKDKPEPGADDKKDEKKDAAPAGDALKESAKENTIILVADSDMLYDPVCVQVQNVFGQRIMVPQYGNLNFAQSLVEQLSGDDNLIAVRSRASLSRPFTVVKEMEARAQDAYRSKIKQLDDSLQETQQRLNDLQRTKDKSQRSILSPEQQAEITKFKKQEAEAKRQLRDVRKTLRRDIDSLETRLKWMNIAGMPLLVAGGGLSLAFLKRKKTAAK